MALADITLADGSKIEGVVLPDWLAPHVTDYLEAMALVQALSVELAEAAAVHAAAEAALLIKQQAFASAKQALDDITASIAVNIGGN